MSMISHKIGWSDISVPLFKPPQVPSAVLPPSLMVFLIISFVIGYGWVLSEDYEGSRLVGLRAVECKWRGTLWKTGDFETEIRRLEGRQNITYAMVSINCGILASGMGGWEGKFHWHRLKLKIKVDQNDLKLTKKGWKQCFVPKKNLFVCRTYTFRGNNSEWSQPGRKPHNQFCPEYKIITFQTGSRQ